MNFLPLESKETNEPPGANGASSVENLSFSSDDESDEPEDYIITNDSSEESESVFEPGNTYNDNQSFTSVGNDAATPVVPLRRSTRTRQLPERLRSGDYVLK